MKVLKNLVHSEIIIFLFMGMIVFLIYSNTLDSPFCFDDTQNIVNNPHIRMTDFDLNHFKDILKSPSKRPVANFTFALNYYFCKYSLQCYHLTNIFIHIVNGIFLYVFLKMTLRVTILYSGGAGFSNYLNLLSSHHSFPLIFPPVILWLVLPVNTQSVTYIVQRMTSLSAMFYLCAFIFFIKGRIAQKSMKVEGYKIKRYIPLAWFSGSLISGGCAIASKQIAASLPFFLLIYDWYFFQNMKKIKSKNIILAFLGVAILCLIITFLFLGINPLNKVLETYRFKDFTICQRMMTELRVLVYYLSLIVYPEPSRLNLDYNYPISYAFSNPLVTSMSLFAIICLIGFAFFIARRDRIISFCIIWFFGNLIIESSFIGLAIIFEHRIYLPSMLVCFLLVWLFHKYRKKKITYGILSLIIVIFAVWTYQRNLFWQDNCSLWQDCISKSPDKARPYSNAGLCLFLKNETTQAISYFERALKIKPDYCLAHINMGIALMQSGRVEEAIDYYAEAIKIDPENVEAHYQMGNALYAKGQLKDSISHYLAALRTSPDDPAIYNNLGKALNDQGLVEEGINQYLKALSLNPDYTEAHINIGIALSRKGRLEEAIEHYLKVIKIDPENVEAHYNLGNALYSLGRVEESVNYYCHALRINPEHPESHNNLGNLLNDQGRVEEAINHYSRAVQLKPDYADAYKNLGITLFTKGDIDGGIHYLKEALKIKPDDIDIRNILQKALTYKN